MSTSEEEEEALYLNMALKLSLTASISPFFGLKTNNFGPAMFWEGAGDR